MDILCKFGILRNRFIGRHIYDLSGSHLFQLNDESTGICLICGQTVIVDLLFAGIISCVTVR